MAAKVPEVSGREKYTFADFKAGHRDSGKLSYREMVKWVLDHVDMEEGEVVSRDAPSPGAWAMLKWVRESDGNRKTFFTSMVVRASGVKEGEGAGEKEERVRLRVQEKMMERVRRVHVAGGIQPVAEDPFGQS